MKYRKLNDEVFYSDERIVKLGKSDIGYLKSKALENKRQRIRLCAHKDEADFVHEMLIVHRKGAYVRPHKHLNKSESFHIIEGKADILIFDEKGKIKQVIRMGDYLSGFCFYYRLREPFYHAPLINSDLIVFHEATKGPFIRDETVFAPWSPNSDDQEAVNRFMKKLQKASKAARKGPSK